MNASHQRTRWAGRAARMPVSWLQKQPLYAKLTKPAIRGGATQAFQMIKICPTESWDTVAESRPEWRKCITVESALYRENRKMGSCGQTQKRSNESGGQHQRGPTPPTKNATQGSASLLTKEPTLSSATNWD